MSMLFGTSSPIISETEEMVIIDGKQHRKITSLRVSCGEISTFKNVLPVGPLQPSESAIAAKKVATLIKLARELLSDHLIRMIEDELNQKNKI